MRHSIEMGLAIAAISAAGCATGERLTYCENPAGGLFNCAATDKRMTMCQQSSSYQRYVGQNYRAISLPRFQAVIVNFPEDQATFGGTLRITTDAAGVIQSISCG